ncbi:MAG: hypothetical protein IJD09_02390 [Clostridia bacterium]|nr:hypothetical protein [Clostridia bacterium]
MGGIFLSYLIALLITVVALIGSVVYLKKLRGQPLCWGALFVGMLVAFGCLIGVLFLFRLTFSAENYYNTVVFRTLIGLLYLSLLNGLRFLLIKTAFFNRYREAQGYSFALGYSAAPTAFLCVYLLIMTVVLGYHCIFNGPAVIADEYLSFGNTIISVFRPVTGHISFAGVFALYLVIVLAQVTFVDKISAKRYRPFFVLLWSVLLVMAEAVVLLPVPFIKMYQLAHWQLVIVAAVMGVISILLTLFIPKPRAVETTYTKQFE